MSSLKTWKTVARWIVAGAMLLTIGLAAAGCASGGSSEPECTENFECDFGEYCNQELGVCEADLRNNDSNNSTPNNNTLNNGTTNNGTTNNNTPDTGPDAGPDGGTNNNTPDTGPDASPDGGTNNNTPDVDPNECSPACGAGESCESGVCVDDEPTCSVKGEPCDPDLPDQGSFWCAGDGDGGGECLPKCSETVTAQGCASGEYCWNIGDQSNPAPACIETQCDNHSDCSSGTCINFDNGFGLCAASGSVSEGQSCDPSVTNECEGQSFCREEPADSGQGTCRRLCDPWGTTSGCPSGQLCDLFTSRDGICSPDTTTSSGPFTSCATSGNMCDDGVICLSFTNDNFCVPYCRTGESDCAGTGGDVVCNNYVVAGERSWGLCLPSCQSAADCCGDQFCPDHECQAGMCLNRCTQGNEVQDCCGGTTPCNWTCNSSGLCE